MTYFVFRDTMVPMTGQMSLDDDKSEMEFMKTTCFVAKDELELIH